MKRICGIVPAMLAVNLPNAYRPPSGDNPALDAQQPRRNILAARIQVRLDRLGFTARAASIKAGLKPDAIRNIVRGKSENPRGDTLRSLARALECSVQYLVSGDDFTEDTPSDDYLPPNLPTLTMSPYIAVRAAAGGGRYIEEEVLGPAEIFRGGASPRATRPTPRSQGNRG